MGHERQEHSEAAGRAFKFSRIYKPLSPSDHDGTFVGAPPQRIDLKVRRMQRESYLQYQSDLIRAEREER
jgi:hypothetical protein